MGYVFIRRGRRNFFFDTKNMFIFRRHKETAFAIEKANSVKRYHF